MEGNRRKSRLAPVLIVAGAVCALLAVYVAGYLLGRQNSSVYCFNAKWKCMLYWPAGRLESLLVGAPVHLCYPIGPNQYTPYEWSQVSTATPQATPQTVGTPSP
jgi:hypothetical protein